MKTALSLILAALTTTATAAAPVANPIENKSETRTIAGEIYSVSYPTDDRDYAITTIETEDGIFEGKIQLWVHDVEDVKTICNNLKKIQNIKQVSRVEE